MTPTTTKKWYENQKEKSVDSKKTKKFFSDNNKEIYEFPRIGMTPTTTKIGTKNQKEKSVDSKKTKKFFFR
jgi:hypothetical protein